MKAKLVTVLLLSLFTLEGFASGTASSSRRSSEPVNRLVGGRRSIASSNFSIGDISLAESNQIIEPEDISVSDISIVESIILNNEPEAENISNVGLSNLSIVVLERYNNDRAGDNLIRRSDIENNAAQSPSVNVIAAQRPLSITSESFTIASNTGTKEIPLIKEEVQNIKYIKEQILSEVISYELPARQIAMLSNLEEITTKVTERLHEVTNMEKIGVGSGDKPQELGLWVKGIGTFGRQKDTRLLDGFKSYAKGFILGVDTIINEDSILGAAYNTHNVNTKFARGSTKENIELHAINLYCLKSITDKADMFTNLTYGRAFVKTKRDLIYKNKNVESKTKGDLFSISLAASYDLDINDSVKLVPQANISYNYLRLKGFTENGLRVSASELQNLILTPSLAISKDIVGNYNILTPRLQYDLNNNVWSRGARSNFTLIETGESLTSVRTGKMREPTYRITGSLNLKRTNNINLILGHSYLWGKSNNSKSVFLQLKFKF